MRAIEVIGEAASKISEATRIDAPEIPWVAIVAMRNRLIHGYFDIDPDIVWATVNDEIPALLPLLQALNNYLPSVKHVSVAIFLNKFRLGLPPSWRYIAR